MSEYQYPPEWLTTTLDRQVDVNLELIELVRAVNNRCEMFLALIATPCESYRLATLLEDLYTDAQTIAHEYCVVKDA